MRVLPQAGNASRWVPTMPTNSEALHEMLANNRLYGTVLRENGTMQLWWLPTFANSPKDCLNAQRWAWVNLGTEGWWANQEQKEAFNHLLSLVGSFPGWPGEYDYFGEYPGTQHSLQRTPKPRR